MIPFLEYRVSLGRSRLVELDGLNVGKHFSGSPAQHPLRTFRNQPSGYDYQEEQENEALRPRLGSFVSD
jgi:hypothetical protein